MRITFDITPRLEKAVLKLAEVFQHPWPVRFDTVECSIGADDRGEGMHATEMPEKAPESASKDEGAVIPAEPEKTQESPKESQEPATVAAPEVTVAPEPAEAVPVAAEPVEEKPVKKPAKKPVKKAPEKAPESASKGEGAVIPAEPEQAQASAKESQEPAPTIEKAPGGDPMAGMTILEASQKLLNEIQERRLEMADVNARMRAKADELGLSCGSCTMLVKAIGYVEARKVMLGEKQ